MMDHLLLESMKGFGMELRRAVRGLWSGVVDRFEFDAMMVSAVNLYFNQAWKEGLKQAGLTMADRTPEEISMLEVMKSKQFGYIQSFAADIIASSKANGGKLTPLLSRTEKWTIRYNEVVATALTMAKNDPILEWAINYVRVVEKNCPSCLKLNGKKKRASTWKAAGIKPQNAPNPMLQCGGWQCGCGLFVSVGPQSKGPFPRLP